MTQSKYLGANDDKINLGPVLAINPRYVVLVNIIGTTASDDKNWIEVHGHGVEWTSELEPLAWCEETAAEFVRRNPKIEIVRNVFDVAQA